MLTAYIHGESFEAVQRICSRLNQRLKSMVSGVELQVLTSERTSATAEPGGYTISGVANVGDSAPELLETVAVLRSAGATHIHVTPLIYRFTEESISVRALRERLKRIH